MASEIHEIEIARRLSSGTHLFIPPLVWDMATVGSAAHLVNLIQQSGRDAKIVAHPDWKDCIPSSWPDSLWVYPEELNYEFQDRPQWTWLWGLGHTKQHSQELNHFLLGLDSIQILDWTNDRVRRRGQFYHDCGYLGGLVELSFVISRDLWPVYNWESCCLGDALRFYIQQYPMTCLDAPIIHMAGQLDLSELEEPVIPELAELRRHENWSVQVYKNLSAEVKQALQLHGLSLYQKDSSENLLLILEDEQGRSDFQILTPHVDLELKLRKCLLEGIEKHSLGGFDLGELDALMVALEKALALSSKEIKKVKPWPTINFSGDHLSFTCHDPQWEIERDNRLHTDELIEEEDTEEEEEEQVNETFDWDANQLIQRLKHLKLPTLKLTRRDLVVAHLPVLRLGDQDLRATYDRIEEERQAELQRKMQEMLDAKEERERLERERLEQERRLQEIETEKLRQAEEAQAQAEAERLAEEERQAQAAEVERQRLAEEQRQAEEQRLAEQERQAEEERLALEQAELEQERARREADRDDYLHSDKEGWGAEEEEKDESEELLESFQQLDRDHPVEENNLYDDEEKLDDSMGIEHPSYEMFEDEEKEEDLQPEELLEELDPEEEPEEELEPEEIIEQLESVQVEHVSAKEDEAETVEAAIEEPKDNVSEVEPEEKLEVQEESVASEQTLVEKSAEETSDTQEPAEETKVDQEVQELQAAEALSEEPVNEQEIEPEPESISEPEEEPEPEPESISEPEEEPESAEPEELCMSPEEIMDQLEDRIEMVDLDPSTVMEDEEQPEQQVEPPAAKEEEEPESQESENEAEFSDTYDFPEEDIEFEPESADVTEVYVNRAEFEEESEDGSVYEFDLDQTELEEEETTQLMGFDPEPESSVETTPEPESEPAAEVLPEPEPILRTPEPPQQEKVYGRETKTGYVNPYLWDHHHRVNDLLSEVRQEKRLRKSDLAYVALVALVLVWAHLNQLPII